MASLEDGRFDSSSLIARLRAGRDDAAFALLVMHYKAVITRTCLAILKDHGEAEDAVQEVFAKAFCKTASFRGENFEAWLVQIARNHCFNVLVRRREIPGLPPDFEQSLWQTPRQEISLKVEILLQELGKLPEGQRLCLKLHYSDGYTYTEIEGLTGYSWDMVRSHIQNGKIALEKRIEQRLAEGRVSKAGAKG